MTRHFALAVLLYACPYNKGVEMNVRIAVVGDRYMPAAVFVEALERRGLAADVTVLQLDDEQPSPGVGAPIREFVGDPAALEAVVPGHDVLVVHAAPVTAAVLAAADRLRLIGCARGGPVNVDLVAATARGVTVVGAPGKNADAVADLTLGFMIMLARGIPAATAALGASGRMGDSVVEGARYMGEDLPGKTLGIVGFGNVGRRVTARAQGFGMDVQAFDPALDDAALEQAGVRPATLEQLLASSDFVSLHARATPQTQSMIGAEQLAAMRPSAYLVNTARESLVDEAALHSAISDGAIAGAAVDVLTAPDGDGPHPLLALDGVIATPHIGGATVETLQCGADMVALEIERLRNGEQPLNAANAPLVEAGR